MQMCTLSTKQFVNWIPFYTLCNVLCAYLRVNKVIFCGYTMLKEVSVFFFPTQIVCLRDWWLLVVMHSSMFEVNHIMPDFSRFNYPFPGIM